MLAALRGCAHPVMMELGNKGRTVMSDVDTPTAGDPPGDPGRQPSGDPPPPPLPPSPQPDPGPPPITDSRAPPKNRAASRPARNTSVEARRLDLTEAGKAT